MGAVLADAIPCSGPTSFWPVCPFRLSLHPPSERNGCSRKGEFKMGQIGRLMTEKVFLTLFFITFFNSGIQNGIAFWMVTFLKETKGFPISLASSSLFLFFACMAVGRLFSSYLLTRLHETTYLLSAFSLLFMSLFFLRLTLREMDHPFLRPLRIGPVWSLSSLLGMTGKIYSEIPGAAMGILATGGGLGSIVIPWLMSLIAQLTDLTAGFLSFEIFIFFCLMLMDCSSGA